MQEAARIEQLEEAGSLCETVTLVVPLGSGNSHPVKVLVHSPKHLHGKPGKIACISLHRGMGISGSAELDSSYCCHLAASIGCVVFNVDYMGQFANHSEQVVSE